MLQDETLEVLVGAMPCFSWFVLGIKVFTLCLSGLYLVVRQSWHKDLCTGSEPLKLTV